MSVLHDLARRARGERRRAKQLGLAGLATVMVGGYLGGHLSFVKGSYPSASSACEKVLVRDRPRRCRWCGDGTRKTSAPAPGRRHSPDTER